MHEAIIKNFDIACRYPYAYQGELLQMIAEKEGLTKDHIVITGGSTEGLKDWCSISTGTIEETEVFCKGIRSVL